MEIDFFKKEPWNSGNLQGMIDVPFLQLTPSTRGGIIRDNSFLTFSKSLETIQEKLGEINEQEKKAEEEEASKNILKSVQRALKEAFLALPVEDYDWFDIYTEIKKPGRRGPERSIFPEEEEKQNALRINTAAEQAAVESAQSKEFYEYTGPLHKAIISPASCIVKVNTSKNFCCIPRDRNKRTVENDIEIRWQLKEGEGSLSKLENEIVTFTAPAEQGLTILQATVTQGDIACTAERIVTVTESLIEKEKHNSTNQTRGLPGYTYLRAPGELWRSKYDEKNNLIIINNGHNDHIFSSQKRSRKLKYICRFFAKELVLKNFLGYDSNELLERMFELSLYTEEQLK